MLSVVPEYTLVGLLPADEEKQTKPKWPFVLMFMVLKKL
jgi:hypothetical protein